MKTIGTIIAIVLLVLVGFWIFDRGDNELANDVNNNGAVEESLTGTGGPEEGFDPLEGIDENLYLDSNGMEGSDAGAVPKG